MLKQIGDRFSFDNSDVRVGGFSEVFRGVDLKQKPPREVAVKILGGMAVDDPLLKTFYDREVESLLTLEHPNIVGLIDAGVDHDGKYYLVLEWIETDLKDWLARQNELRWEDFIGSIGLPLTEALAYAHQRHVIHRDIKPGNVLVTPEQIPKLADFGIAKIKSDLTFSQHTTIDFVSRPYSPPEQDSTFSRDVFGIGALLIGAISGRILQDYPDIESALHELDVPVELSGLLERCVSFTPDRRPKNALILHEELKSFMDARRTKRVVKSKIYLEVIRSVEEKWSELTSITFVDAKRAILKDLSEDVSLRQDSLPDSYGQMAGRRLFLGGAIYSYRAKIIQDSASHTRLLITGILLRRSGDVDRSYEKDLLLSDYGFSFEHPNNYLEADEALTQFVADLEAHIAKRDEVRGDIDQRRLLEEWRSQLAARQEVEKRKESPLHYRGFNRNGKRVNFKVEDDLTRIEIGEIRKIDVGVPGRLPTGEVESASHGEVAIYFENELSRIPTNGRLLLDTSAASIKIDREKAALLGLIHRGPEVVNHALRSVIINPETQTSPDLIEIVTWQSPNLDEDKKEAVRAALGNTGMFAIEGPPGTGKTTFIAELVAQEIARNPESRILISSQTNVALDNALVRIGDFVKTAKVIRLADRHGLKVSDAAKSFLLEQQIESWRARATKNARDAFDAWCNSKGVKAIKIEMAGVLQVVANLKEAVNGHREAIEKVKAAIDYPASRLTPDEISHLQDEISDIKEKEKRARDEYQDLGKRFVKELRGSGIDLENAPPGQIREFAHKIFGPIEGERQRVDLFISWCLRLQLGEDFLEEVLNDAQVLGGTCIGIGRHKEVRSLQFDLCIVDEASKATATETLVPLVRSKRWVLVGDQRQLPPFQEEALSDKSLIEEFELDENELRSTLFDRMLVGLPPHSKMSLRVQRRMTKSIGTMVSECFYEGQLESRGPEPLEGLIGVLTKPITWWSTSSLERHNEVSGGFDGKSFSNPAEARAIRDIVKRLVFVRKTAKISGVLEVLVIAPYNAQVFDLRRQFAGIAGQLDGVSIEINSIDAVQGREADLVIFSTVRSNSDAHVGFLNSVQRINVALSRARQGLIIVGDYRFLSGAPSPLKEVISFIERHPEFAKVEEIQ